MKKLIFVLLFLLPILAFAESAAVKTPPAFEAGKDYLVLPENSSTDALKSQDKNKITVIEFFNYGCPACNRLDPYLEKWLAHKPENVVFERIPVVFDPGWGVYAKTYLVIHQENLSSTITPAIFKAIHEDNMDLSNKDAMGEFLNGKEIKKDAFLNLYNSPDIDIQMAKNKKITNDFLIFQIPGIVIDGKYKVDPSLSGGNYPRLLETVDYLITLAAKDEDKKPATATTKPAAVQKDDQKQTG